MPLFFHALVFLALCVGTAICISDASFIRREGQGAQQAQFDQAGHIQIVGDAHSPPAGTDASGASEQPELFQDKGDSKSSAVTPCNTQYLVMGQDGEDQCTGSPPTQDIEDSADCQIAATALSLTFGGVVTNHDSVTKPIVHKCYKNQTDGKAYFYTPDTNHTGTLEGRKICWRTHYHFVKPSTGESGDLCATQGDAVKLPHDDSNESRGECVTAQTCTGYTCTRKFTNGDYETHISITDESKPSGCWMDANGCWSHNNKAPADVNFETGVDFQQVCVNTCTAPDCASGR